MAMICGHFEPDKEVQSVRIQQKQCPVCPGEELADHNQVIPHGYCACCKECWVLMPEYERPVRSVFHDGY